MKKILLVVLLMCSLGFAQGVQPMPLIGYSVGSAYTNAPSNVVSLTFAASNYDTLFYQPADNPEEIYLAFTPTTSNDSTIIYWLVSGPESKLTNGTFTGRGGMWTKSRIYANVVDSLGAAKDLSAVATVLGPYRYAGAQKIDGSTTGMLKGQYYALVIWNRNGNTTRIFNNIQVWYTRKVK